LDGGRIATDKFDVRYYLQQNPDLSNIGFNYRQAYEHFTQYGLKEGRNASNLITSDFAGNNFETAREIAISSNLTTVRDAGSRGYGIVALKNREIQTSFALPYVLVSGPPITPTGGHLYWMGGEVDGVREIRAAVRERVKRGVDVIKIIATGGKMTPNTRPENVAYSFRELQSAVAEAHRLGVRVTAHCLNARGIRLAVKSKIDCIDHAAFFVRNPQGQLVRMIDKEAAQLLADTGVYVIPCLSAGYHRLDEIRNQPKTAEDYFQLEQERLMFEHFTELVKKGVQMVVGTDAGVTLTPFNETFLELILMVRAGLQPEEALRAATYHAAQALGLSGRKGVIQAGADADIVGSLSDPTTDIAAVRNIVWVMREGRIIIDRRENKEGGDVWA
ncbi:MAG: amidohydrolase family protein, partial [Thermoproteota archaeon]